MGKGFYQEAKMAMQIHEIETAITNLNKRQLAQFRKWFEEYDA